MNAADTKPPLYREKINALEHYKAIEAAAEFSNGEAGQFARAAAEALCKQIREKPVRMNECPACRRHMMIKHNFCPDCGQALDWQQEG